MLFLYINHVPRIAKESYFQSTCPIIRPRLPDIRDNPKKRPSHRLYAEVTHALATCYARDEQVLLQEPCFIKMNPNGRILVVADRSRRNYHVFELSAILRSTTTKVMYPDLMQKRTPTITVKCSSENTFTVRFSTRS
jgi:hypothetical protein